MLDYTLAFILAATHRQVAKRSVALIPGGKYPRGGLPGAQSDGR
jgi:hypothetical protein